MITFIHQVKNLLTIRTITRQHDTTIIGTICMKKSIIDSPIPHIIDNG